MCATLSTLRPSHFLRSLLGNSTTAIEEVARFVTPLGSPRRFDARFLVALAPSGQEPSHDKGEIVNWDWIRPQDALDRWAAGELEMLSPTVRLVACLSRYRSAPQVMAVAKKRLDYKRVRVDDPEGEYRVVLPGEPLRNRGPRGRVRLGASVGGRWLTVPSRNDL